MRLHMSVLLVAGLVAGCGSASEPSPAPTPTVAVPASAMPAPSSTDIAPTAAPASTPDARGSLAAAACPERPWTLDVILAVPDGQGETAGASPAVPSRAACFGGATVVLVAQVYEPTTTGRGPAGFGVPVRAFAQRGAPSLDGSLGDGAVLPADQTLRSSGDRPPGGGGEVWWEVTGHFDDPAAAGCASDETTLEQAREACRNDFFIDRMRVLIERHLVLPGETFLSIAKAHGVSIEALLMANAWIADESSVQSGDLVTIPRVPAS